MKSDYIKKQIDVEMEKTKKFFLKMSNPDPDRDWFIVISFLSVSFFIVVIWSIALYFLYFPTAIEFPGSNISYGSV
ncbi:MAG: hypothetical protein WCV55_03030, partial [Candidatus Paceibacterota bacterium]